MFNNGSIYEAINIAIRKDSSGGSFSPDDMTRMLRLCQNEKANSDYKQYEAHQIITDSLRSLEKSSTISLTANIGVIPNDYWHIKSIIVNSYYADIVVEQEWRERFYSHAMPAKTWSPMARVVGSSFQVYPEATSALFEYFKIPTEPYFDYYLNADDNIVYLQQGTAYTLLSGETYIDKDDGTERTSGYTISSVENKSVELFFPELDRIDVLYRILQKLGLSLDKELQLQYGIQGENKEQIK